MYKEYRNMYGYYEYFSKRVIFEKRGKWDRYKGDFFVFVIFCFFKENLK